jgi:hypothetical protein
MATTGPGGTSRLWASVGEGVVWKVGVEEEVEGWVPGGETRDCT